MSIQYRYHHYGIPVREKTEDMMHLKHLQIYVTDHESNEFGIQQMFYEPGCNLPELVRTVPHIAFEVDNLQEAIKGKRVIVSPNSPSPGLTVAMIEEAGVPVELMQFERA